MRVALAWLLCLAAPAQAATLEDEPAPAGVEKNRVIVVVPIGEPAPALVEHVAESLRERFIFDIRLAPGVAMPREAWYEPRKRWRADELLDFLDELDVGEAWRVTGITEKPISTTKGDIKDWGIAGLGSLGGRSSVYTAYLFRRFKKKRPARYKRYMENLVLHEVGHTLGLRHCPLDRCIMADAKGNAIAAARKSTNEFCPRCHHLIQAYLRATTVQGKWSEP
jgi:archaemetzincin